MSLLLRREAPIFHPCWSLYSSIRALRICENPYMGTRTVRPMLLCVRATRLLRDTIRMAHGSRRMGEGRGSPDAEVRFRRPGIRTFFRGPNPTIWPNSAVMRRKF